MNRRWIINREHIEYLRDTIFDGSLSAFVNRSGVDKNTVRRWLKKEEATTYSSTVLQLSRALSMPPAAFAFQQRQSPVPPDWLRAFRDLSGSSMRFMSVGKVLPIDRERPFVRSWPYKAPVASCWGLLELRYDEHDIDLELFGMRTVARSNVAIQLARMSMRYNRCDIITSWPPWLDSATVSEGRSLRMAVAYDGWPEGFVVRANAPFSISEVGLLCGSELARLKSEQQVVSVAPLAIQSEPPMSSPACLHCFEGERAQPPAFARKAYSPPQTSAGYRHTPTSAPPASVREPM